MFHRKAVPALAIAFALACSGGGGDADSAPDQDLPDMSTASAADLPDPCGLVTDQEVSDLLWRGIEPGQREPMQARNAEHTFTKRVEDVDFPPGRTCYFQYQRVAGDTVWSEGDFKLRTLARETFEMFVDAGGTHEDIPGVGDQAFYFQNAAYGRRGDVGVEVVEFGSRELEIELLKQAVARLPQE